MLEERDYQFVRAVQARPIRFTYVFLGINILIFILMELAGGSLNNSTLMAFGATSKAAIDRGEIWRLITPMFIHIGILHLVINSYSLWNIGPVVESLYGGPRFVILYLTAGAAGALASYASHPFGLSAGASGAIFGLCGVLGVFSLKNRNAIPAYYRKALLSSVLISIAMTLYMGFRYSGIDNAGHIGGLLAGGLLAVVIPFENPAEPEKQGGSVFKIGQAALLLIVLLSFYAVFAHYHGPKFSVSTTMRRLNPISKEDTGAGAAAFMDAVSFAQAAFGASLNAIGSGHAADIAESKRWTAAAIEGLKEAPPLGDPADAWVHRFLTALENEYALELEIERAGAVSSAHTARAQDNTRRYRQLVRDYRRWVETDGSRFGIELRPSSDVE